MSTDFILKRGNSIEKVPILQSSFLIESYGFRHGRHYHLDPQVDPKTLKRHFIQDIQNSFQCVTGVGLKPSQFFLFKISQQIRSLEAFKILAEMGCDGQAE